MPPNLHINVWSKQPDKNTTTTQHNQGVNKTITDQGRESARLLALEVIKAAIGRYKFLAEGPCSGEAYNNC